MDSPFVIAFSNLSNVKGDIDLGRADLPAGRQRVLLCVEMKQALGRGFYGEYVFGTGPFTGAASHAFFLIHNGKPFRSYFQGVKQAGLHTVATLDALVLFDFRQEPD